MCVQGPSNGKRMLHPGGESRDTRLSTLQFHLKLELNSRPGAPGVVCPALIRPSKGDPRFWHTKHKAQELLSQHRGLGGLNDRNASPRSAGDQSCKVRVSAELGASEALRENLPQACPLAAGALLTIVDKPWFVELCLHLTWHSP